MATSSRNQDFYKEVDRYRNQRGCLTVGLLVIFIAVILVAVWYFFVRRSVG